MKGLRRTVAGGLAFLAFLLGGAAAAPAQDELIQLVVGLLEGDDKDLRALAFEQIRTQAPGEASTLKFAALLPTLPPDARVGMLSALAQRRDTAAAPAVRELLATSEHDSVKVAAIEALSTLGGPDDLKLLVWKLQEGSQTERVAARRSLEQIPGEAMSAAIAAEMQQAPAPLSAGSETRSQRAAPAQLRVQLIQILTERRARGSVDALLQAAVDDDPTVRTAAIKALGQLADAKQVPGMVQAVLKAERGRERDAAERAVVLVSHRIADPRQQAAPLLAAMDGLTESDRLLLLPALGRVGSPAALDVVQQAVSDARPEVRESGVRALSLWPDASVVPRLLTLARAAPDPAHRRLALRAILRVAPLPDERTDQRRLDVLRTALAMSEDDADRRLALERAKAIRAVQTLRFVTAYFDQPDFAQQACETVVELAHHSELRESHKDEFHGALDRVIEISQNATVVDRAQRYKTGQTWVRPKARQ